MKCFAIVFLLFAGLVALTYAADCEIDGHKFNKGETYIKSGECSEYTCSGPGSFTLKGCPESAAPASCKRIEDKSKPYPGCCPQHKC